MKTRTETAVATSNTSVRVLLASSPARAETLRRLLAGAPGLEIVGLAGSARDVLRLLPDLRPALLCIDETSPLDGLELSRAVMSACPCPILLLSDAPNASHPALDAGALAVMPRPGVLSGPNDAVARQLVAKIKMLACVPVIGRRSSKVAPAVAAPAPQPATPPVSTINGHATTDFAPRLVAIGASTGGPQALLRILSFLPLDFPLPILCVQHVSLGFLHGLVDWLDEQCRLNVTIARDGEVARAGIVYFPPEKCHLEVSADNVLRVSTAPPVGNHRPSVTTLFQSVARAHGSRALAILLTGMGTDGALGLQAVADAGGQTVAQNAASCVVYGMPRAAIEAGAAKQILSPDEIARYLLNLGRNA